MAEKHEFDGALAMVRSMTTCASCVDWPKLITACERADALGPMLDPTLYREAMHKHAAMKTLFRAANRFLTEAREAVARLEAEENR